MAMTEFATEVAFETDPSSPGRWLMSHLRHHWPLLLIMFIGAFGNAALAAALPILTGVAFDAALAMPPNMTTIGWVAIGIIASQVIRAILQLGRNFSSAVIGERLERDMRRELYVSLLGKSMTFHDRQAVGETMARATNDVHEINLLMYPGINLVVGSANFLIMPLILAPRYAPQLILAPLFFIVTYILALIRYMNVLQSVSDRVRATFGKMNARLAEAIDGVELVKSTAQEDNEIARFDRNASDYPQCGRRTGAH